MSHAAPFAVSAVLKGAASVALLAAGGWFDRTLSRRGSADLLAETDRAR